MKRITALLAAVLMVFLAAVPVSAADDHEHVFVWKYPSGSRCSDPDRVFIHVCEICGKIDDTRVTPASGHEIEEDWTVYSYPTIDSAGYSAKKCKYCDEIMTAHIAPKLEATDDFIDVPEDAWYAHAVSYCCALGFFAGMGDNVFYPELGMTRAMFVTVAASLCGADRTAYTETPFDDVDADSWYASSVAWAADKGIVYGIGGGLFAPDVLVTREEAAAIMMSVAGYLDAATPAADDGAFDAFNDAGSVSDWASPAMKWAVTAGLFGGYDGGIHPDGTATRAQIAQVVTNFYDIIRVVKDKDDLPLYIASDRRLFVEDSLIDTEATTAERVLYSPEKQEKVFSFDAAWERNDTVYHNISVAPDGTYRMYYKATGDVRRIAYIESKDGLTWTRPDLDTYLYNNKSTNCVTDNGAFPDNMFVFYDSNPDCEEDKHWKGIYGQWGDGLFLEWSVDDDGQYFPFWLNGSIAYERPIFGKYGQFGNASALSGGCFFDTLNTVYWDAARGKYVGFVRGFHKGDEYQLSEDYVRYFGLDVTRDIRYTESTDGVNWTTPVPLEYSDGNDYQMYANAVMPYERAAGLYVAVPTRYNLVYYDPLTGFVKAFTDNFFMASYDLENWTRYVDEPYMLPFDPEERELVYGDCYPCVGMIETPTAEGTELSLYMKEARSKDDTRTYLYRYTLRLDGFASMSAGSEQKVVVTRPFTFAGDKLEINYRTTRSGSIRVTVEDEYGNSITSDPLVGDSTAMDVKFSDGSLSDFESKTVTVSFDLIHADLYSFKFS